MRNRVGLKALAVGVCLSALSLAAHAEENAVAWPSMTSEYTTDMKPIVLAANEVEQAKAPKKPTIDPNANFEEPWLTGRKAHKYLGLATIASALATGMTNPCEQNCPNPRPSSSVHGTHAKLAALTVGLASATVVSGLISHWDDFAAEDGVMDRDNLHVMLAGGGAALMAIAAARSANKTAPVNHGHMAVIGAIMMGVGIKMTW